MIDYNVYEDVAKRSGGDIYIGVVGPVRTGKSTLIKKFMTELVIPNVENGNEKNVMTDEMPQSASGRQVMTSEPKFIPAKAIKLKIENATANIRFADCVGFMTEGATGFEEDGVPRKVNTPWSDMPIPLSEAAKIGTDKVISEHSTIGILVTCDGSFSEIPRSGYISAEERTVARLKVLKKPFVIVLNCSDPSKTETQNLKAELEEKYGVSVLALNLEQASSVELVDILKGVLFEFDITTLDVTIPEWVRFLPADSQAVGELLERIRKFSKQVRKMKDCTKVDDLLDNSKFWKSQVGLKMDLANGKVSLECDVADGVFFTLLSELAATQIDNEYSLMQFVSKAAEATREYDKVKDAFESARVNGYGIVMPNDNDMSLDNPEIVRKNGSVGIKLKASAPCYHILKVDVAGEVSPIMGSASQSESIVSGMMTGFENNPDGMWDTNVFGKSLREMVKDGLYVKVTGMHDDVKVKMRRTINRIVNEGRGGVICILL